MKEKLFNHVPDKWQLEDIEARTTEEGRVYNSPVGNLPSVTTVTGWEKNQFFAQWRKDNPEESRRVLKRGNHLHSFIEDYLNNEIDPNEITWWDSMPGILELFEQIQPELDNIDNIHALESPLWSEAMMLAGRVDCVAEYKGKLSIIDFKGSTRPKKKKDIENYFLQATAYAIAWQERTGIPIDNFVIMITTDDGITQVFEGNPMNYVKMLFKTIEKYHESVSVLHVQPNSG